MCQKAGVELVENRHKLQALDEHTERCDDGLGSLGGVDSSHLHAAACVEQARLDGAFGRVGYFAVA